ncbi:hypothetical protein PR001_g22162 [Phytophthora rubi]|uniref:Uncharacterized protein n=1 Tax=Phytophthora rubi TaxID=129364 RepID=A0A6A3IY01_9STRA|nr:hypothetical protein PR001_g22162 [Phytophthora rubi]
MEGRDDPPDPGVPRNAGTAGKNPPAEMSQPQAENNSSETIGANEQAAGNPGESGEPDPNASITAPEIESEPNQGQDIVAEVAEERQVSFTDLLAQLETIMDQGGFLNEQEEDVGKQFMQQMFTLVFKQHKQKQLPDEKAHYPSMQIEELRGLLRLFQLEVKQHDGTAQEWLRRLRGLVASIFDSKRSLLDGIALKESEIKVHHTRNENPWANYPLLQKTKAEEDDPMGEDSHPSVVRFKTDVYSQEEIATMRGVYEAPYDFPTELREPSQTEKQIIQGLLEGTILAQELPQFLKRTCNNEMLRVIQNTIHAQVEGELMFRLPGQFPMYPDFQTRDRLCNAVGRPKQQEVIDLVGDGDSQPESPAEDDDISIETTRNSPRCIRRPADSNG